MSEHNVNDESEPERCWCGVEAVHETWCREHAPRCRSGAHFHGNCRCVGDQELARRRRSHPQYRALSDAMDQSAERIASALGRVFGRPDRRVGDPRSNTRRQEDRTREVVETQQEERAMRMSMMRRGDCLVPPAGWRCTRPAGHSGPCAAVAACGCSNGCAATGCVNL